MNMKEIIFSMKEIIYSKYILQAAYQNVLDAIK